MEMQTLLSTVSTNNAFKNRELKHGIVINECCSFVNIYVCVFAFLQSNAAAATAADAAAAADADAEAEERTCSCAAFLY